MFWFSTPAVVALVALLGLQPPPPPPSAPTDPNACADPSGLCLRDPASAEWLPDEHTTRSQRRKRGKGAPGQITVEIPGGRGSIFLQGRYAGTAPVTIPIEDGPNDLQVRDGANVLASGVLIVASGATIHANVRGK